MSVKLQFLKKLQARQPAPVPAISKSEADIAEFRQRMAQLQEQMDAWLTDTGLNVEPLTVSVPDLLVEGGAFEIPVSFCAMTAGRSNLCRSFCMDRASPVVSR